MLLFIFRMDTWMLLWQPIRKNLNYLIGLGLVIRLQVQAEIVNTPHVAVH